MLNLGDVYKKEKDKWVSRFILDEVVIMPLCRSGDDIQYIYSISNETGTRIFSLLDGTHTVRDIQEAIKAEFKGNAETIERDVLEFLKDLASVKLIEKGNKRKKEKTKDESRQPRCEERASTRKRIYKTPEIAKIKMQPEQAVLACCLSRYNPRNSDGGSNACGSKAACPVPLCYRGSGGQGASVSALNS